MIAKLGMIASLASSAVGAMGAMAQANAQAEAEEARAEAERRAAAWEIAKGHHEAERKRDEASKNISRSQSIAAASGGVVTDVAELLGSTKQEGELQAAITQANQDEKGKGHEYQAKIHDMQASNYRSAGSIGMLSSGISAISGASKLLG